MSTMRTRRPGSPIAPCAISSFSAFTHASELHARALLHHASESFGMIDAVDERIGIGCETVAEQQNLFDGTDVRRMIAYQRIHPGRLAKARPPDQRGNLSFDGFAAAAAAGAAHEADNVPGVCPGVT